MGYEIIFSYRQASDTEKGVYEDEIKSKKVKIGSSEDNLGLEAAAGRIFAQFARRNILVTEVEIWEYSKKKLSFKETDDGFLIKNRKFRFDDGTMLAPSEELLDLFDCGEDEIIKLNNKVQVLENKNEYLRNLLEKALNEFKKLRKE